MSEEINKQEEDLFDDNLDALNTQPTNKSFLLQWLLPILVLGGMIALWMLGLQGLRKLAQESAIQIQGNLEFLPPLLYYVGAIAFFYMCFDVFFVNPIIRKLNEVAERVVILVVMAVVFYVVAWGLPFQNVLLPVIASFLGVRLAKELNTFAKAEPKKKRTYEQIMADVTAGVATANRLESTVECHSFPASRLIGDELHLNLDHPLIHKLQSLDPRSDEFRDCSRLLYQQAVLLSSEEEINKEDFVSLVNETLLYSY